MLGSILAFHRQITVGDCRNVTQKFDIKEAGRRIFKIYSYRPSNIDTDTMTQGQGAGFIRGINNVTPGHLAGFLVAGLS